MSRKYIYGINTVEQSLKNSSRKMYRLIVENSKASKLMAIIKLANRRKISVQFAPQRLIEKLSDSSTHQGVVLEIDDVYYYSIDEIVNDKNNRMLLCLDGVIDPQNFGSIIRTSVCMGFDGIIFSENRNSSITPTVEKISCGAVEKIKFIRVVNINQTLIYLKKNNYWVYGADISGRDIREVNFNFPVIVVVGSEGEGIHKKTKEHCDELIRIPQVEYFDSLNVSVASAIVMYEIKRRI